VAPLRSSDVEWHRGTRAYGRRNPILLRAAVRFSRHYARFTPNSGRPGLDCRTARFDPNQTLVEEEKIPAAPRVCFWCDWARANGNRSAFPYNPAPYGVNVTGHASAFLLTSIENISFRPRTSLKATVRMCWAI
jgi:hypothetical protein